MMNVRFFAMTVATFLIYAPIGAADGVPANPWANKTSSASQNVQPMPINVNNQTADFEYSASVPVQNVQRRNAGGVGKISAPRQSRKITTTLQDNDQTSSFTNLFSDENEENKTPAVETNSSSVEIPDMNINFDSEYNKIKRKGLNKWNNATAPIKKYYEKWKKALQETSEMNLKDLMQ